MRARRTAITIHSTLRRASIALALVCAMLAGTNPTPGQGPPPPADLNDLDDAGLHDAMAEMAAIEEQIEDLLLEQAVQSEEIDDLNRDLTVASKFMTGSDDLRTKGRRVLDSLDREAGRDIGIMEDAERSGRARLRTSTQGVRLSAPLLLHALDNRGPADARTVALAVLAGQHRGQAHLAVEQLLRLTELQTSRAADQRRIQSLRRRHSEFSKLKLDELRTRHRELSGSLDRAYSSSRRIETHVASLTEQRQALDGLIARLTAPRYETQDAEVELEPAAGDIEDLTGGAEVTLAEVPYDDEQTQLALGTRAGDGRPTVEFDIPPDASAGGPEGGIGPAAAESHRQWRAGATDVFAIASGRVLFSGAFAGYAHLLVVDHGRGWTSVHGNLTSCSLVEGQAVAGGALLGRYDPQDSNSHEPFWIEIRRETQPVPIQSMPQAGPDWERKVFGSGQK